MQVFRFLKAFAERNLPIRRRLDEQLWRLDLWNLPSHPTIELGQVVLTDSEEGNETATEDVAPLLRVRRPKITAAPDPPALIASWVKGGWKHPDGSPEVEVTRTLERDGETISEEFASDSARVFLFNHWKWTWAAWAKSELLARQAMRIFERLYELRGRIERESESVELLVGDGRLRWRTPAGVIDHPIVLQRVELIFDADVPEFRILDADRPPELYVGLLQAAEGLATSKLSDLRGELEKGGYHPLAGPETSAYLRRLAALVHAQGKFVEKHTEQSAQDEPVLMRSPALFLRTRLSGFPMAFEAVLAQLANGASLPISLSRLVGVEPPPPADSDPAPTSPWGEPPDVLLSKPANLEQVQIARALDRHSAVLVQGPPGTGKSHTIANLIGHLVAQGKRVLVTSHTTKALRVLRGQIAETLQPLAVAVLDRDLESRSQMESSVRSILARLTLATSETLAREVGTAQGRRNQLNAEINRLTSELREVRNAEYEPIHLAGEAIEPAEAARWVSAHQTANDWIPSPVEAGAPLPLSEGEIRRLYELNGLLTSDEESEINSQLPDPSAVPEVGQFLEWVQTARGKQLPALSRFWERPSGERDLPAVENFHSALTGLAAELRTLSLWQRSLVRAGHSGSSEWSLWENLALAVSKAHRLWQSHRQLLMKHHVRGEFGDDLESATSVNQAILQHLEGHRSVGTFQRLLHPRWKSLIDAARVDGSPPSNVQHFRAIAAHLEIRASRNDLTRDWSRLAEPAGFPPLVSLGPDPEPAMAEFASEFPGLGAWWSTRWTPIVELAKEAGFRIDEFRRSYFAKAGDIRSFERDEALVTHEMVAAIERRLEVGKWERASRKLKELAVMLERFEGKAVANVLKSVKDHNATAFDVARKEMIRLTSKTKLWQERHDLTAKLEKAAPAWARALRARRGNHAMTAVPGDPSTAWRWRQLHDEIERRAKLDAAELARQLEQRRNELRAVTTELIDRKAWLAQLERTDLAARQALQGWADAVRKIGKGTGKRTVELQGQARRLLDRARNAVPVWIMPLSRVAESFDPAAGRFDVVIVDEASQSDVQGLLAWYLGDRVAIVGDHEQVSPMAVGQDLDTIESLIRQHLHDVPNHFLYDGKTSVYDLGRQCFGGTIALREHFRCVPDIIEFSSGLSYDYEIRPLRNPSTAPQPHVAEFVATGDLGTGRQGKSNEAEARAVVSLMAAVIEQPEFARKSVGAITLLGDDQAFLIQKLALDVIGAAALEARRFVAGNSAQFQGDERDIVFLSMVDSPADRAHRMVQTPEMKQRYNVAASRAKDLLWLVHSLDPGRDLQAGDLRRRLIEHVRDPGARRRELENKAKRTESPFEKEVLERFFAANYDVEPQVWVGRYRLDFVVRGGGNEVAVECDGDRFHDFDRIGEDMFRQAVLERAGWRFVRIRGTRFYRDREKTMREVFEELARFEVIPDKGRVVDQSKNVGSELRERVVRRAWEIMHENGWIGVAPQAHDEIGVE